MGIEPQAEKKESQSAEHKDAQADDRSLKYKGYKGGSRRFTKKKSAGNKEVTISKSKFKGALDALVDYYFDTGPTQAHDFKKTHKKISTYTGSYDVNRGDESSQLDGNNAKETNQIRFRYDSRWCDNYSNHCSTRT
jgi:hypothetical protein